MPGPSKLWSKPVVSTNQWYKWIQWNRVFARASAQTMAKQQSLLSTVPFLSASCKITWVRGWKGILPEMRLARSKRDLKKVDGVSSVFAIVKSCEKNWALLGLVCQVIAPTFWIRVEKLPPQKHQERLFPSSAHNKLCSRVYPSVIKYQSLWRALLTLKSV